MSHRGVDHVDSAAAHAPCTVRLLHRQIDKSIQRQRFAELIEDRTPCSRMVFIDCCFRSFLFVAETAICRSPMGRMASKPLSSFDFVSPLVNKRSIINRKLIGEVTVAADLD